MCNCENKYNKKPDEYCLYCAEKHLSTAMQAYNETGYLDNNRQFIIGQLELARKHLSENDELAQKIRELRHKIQDRRIQVFSADWNQICSLFNMYIDKENQEKISGKIYVFSNVIEDKKNKLETNKNDLLVFLNKAVNFEHYKNNHGMKICFRRSKDESYGKNIKGIINRFVFDDKRGIEEKFLTELKSGYDFNYTVPDGNTKCMTTGYMVTEYLHNKYPNKEIVLVNFGYEVSESSFRCRNHNWKFESEKLKKYKHVYTVKTANIEENKPVKLLIRSSGWLGDNVYLTAVIHNIFDTGKIAVNVVSNHPQIYVNNPYLDESITAENADYILQQNYNSDWKQNCKHIIELVTEKIAYNLNIDIPCKHLKSQLYFELKQPIIQGEYVVINNGYQSSAETKKYNNEYWQEIIDQNSAVRFVQIGQKKNHAIPLKNTLNFIDKTSIEELVNIIYYADCIISPVSGCIHIAGAFNKPYIALSGGRQPENLTKYQNGIYFSALNTLDCCMGKGCHRNKFQTENEAKKCLHCTKYNDEITADCMLSIKPDQITKTLTKLLQKKTD